jgi:hypothetical protein
MTTFITCIVQIRQVVSQKFNELIKWVESSRRGQSVYDSTGVSPKTIAKQAPKSQSRYVPMPSPSPSSSSSSSSPPLNEDRNVIVNQQTSNNSLEQPKLNSTNTTSSQQQTTTGRMNWKRAPIRLNYQGASSNVPPNTSNTQFQSQSSSSSSKESTRRKKTRSQQI